jgi:hypothetical protein
MPVAEPLRAGLKTGSAPASGASARLADDAEDGLGSDLVGRNFLAVNL